MAAVVLAAINAKWIHPSLALRLLRANLDVPALRPEDCVIREFALRQNRAEMIAAILAEAPVLLALSVSVWNHRATLELLADLKPLWSTAHCSPPVIVLGGPEVTFLPPDAALFDHATFVIRGEGEEVFSRLCRDVLADRDKAHKTWGRFIDAAPADLAGLQSPYGLYSGEDLRRRLVYVEASRGCPCRCAFCQSALDPVLREFPLETFLAGLEELLARTARTVCAAAETDKSGPARRVTIKFLDRSFNAHIPRALRILEHCLAWTNRGGGEPFQFHFEMVPAWFPGELRDLLGAFPPESLRLEIGIQSFNPRTSALIRRNSSPEGELELLRFLRARTKAILHVDLIAGLPGEDLASFGEGFDRLWLALTEEANGVPFEIQPGILKCLPGTPLHAMAEDGAFVVRYNKDAPYEVLETGSLPLAGMERIKNFARFWELTVNRGHFPELLDSTAPPGKAVFRHFMELSEKLLARFGRNWGIPRHELREALAAYR